MPSTLTAFLRDAGRAPQRITALMIAAAALSVVASYGFMVAVDRSSARFYLGSVVWFAIALVPYLLCAFIWLPRWQSRAAALAGMTTSGLLLLYAVASSAWRVTTDQWGGDMQALFVIHEAGVVAFGVIVVSVLAYAVSWRVVGSEPPASIRPR
jgi:hypothetical protein